MEESKAAAMEEKVEKTVEKTVQEGGRLKVVFRKPYTFEHVAYTELDLSGLEDMTGMDLIEVGKNYGRGNNVALYQEYESDFCFALAARAADKPIEFFYAMPIKDSIQVKETVTHFFLSRE